MKKGLSILLCFLILFYGCSKRKSTPENISEGMYTIGCKTLKIADKYLNADLTLDEAYDELDSMQEQAQELRNDDYDSDLSLAVAISSLAYDLWNMNKPFGSTETDVDFKEDRDYLAGLLDN